MDLSELRPEEMKLQNCHDTATQRRFLELYEKGMSTRQASEEVGVSCATGYKWAHEAGIIRPKAEAIRLFYRNNPRKSNAKPKPKPTRNPPGITYKTLIKLEKEMPFQEAVDKVMSMFCGDAPQSSYAMGGGLEERSIASTKAVRHAA